MISLISMTNRLPPRTKQEIDFDLEMIRNAGRDRAARPAPPLVEFGRQVLADRAARGQRSARSYQSIYREHYEQLWAGLELRDWNDANIAAQIVKLRDRDRLSRSTIRNVLNVGRIIFKAARAQHVVETNPYVGFDAAPLLPEAPAKRRRRFKREEVERVLGAETIPLRWRVLFALLFLTGARVGEILALVWGAIEPEAPLAAVNLRRSWNSHEEAIGPTKTGTEKRLPLHPLAAEFLRAWRFRWTRLAHREPGADDLVFPSAFYPARARMMGRPLNCWSVLQRFKRDLGRLGIDPHRTHDTRHTFVSLLLDARADRAVVKGWTHPSPSAAFDRYADVSWDEQCAEMAKLQLRPRRLEPIEGGLG